MPSLREQRLQEQVAEIGPQLAKAREIAEKAESENRAMTDAEQKIYDEGVSNARDVADAVKQYRHDQEVFAFAKDLSDNVIGGLGGDLSGSGIGAKSGQRLSFKHMGASVARQMLPDGMKALAPSGGAVVGQEMKPDPVSLGQPALSLLDVIPVTAHAQPEFAYMRQTVRTNLAAVVAEGLTKPTSMLSVTRIEQSLAVVRTSRRASRGIGCSTPAPWRRRARSPGLLGQLADTGAQGRPGGGCPVCLGSFSPAMLHAMCCG